MAKKLNADDLAKLADKVDVVQDDIAPKRIKPTAHASYDQVDNLSLYDAILDNLAFGVKTKTTIKYCGVDWTFRMLGNEEEQSINYQVSKMMGDDIKNGIATDKFRYQIEEAVRTIHLALSPTPFYTKNNAGEDKVYDIAQIRLIPKDILINLLSLYRVFVQKATQDPEELTVEQIEAVLQMAKGKPEVLLALDYNQYVALTRYLMNYSQALEQKIQSALNN